ncbi:hypothetical protein EMCRGX_G013028 [Ephydatia muelleri]
MQLNRTPENINFIQGTYTLKLCLTGDLEFLSKMYGLSDASGFGIWTSTARPTAAFTAVQPTRKQCTLFDVGMKTVPKKMSSRVDHSIRLDPAVVQQQEHRRQAHQDREQRAVLAEMTCSMEPVDGKDVQRGKRGPYASGLGRWPQQLKSLAIERHSCRYPGWLNIPRKTINGQPARGVLGPWSAVNGTTEHLKLNFDAFAKLSEKTLENWLQAHKIAYLEEGSTLTGQRRKSAWKHPWTLPTLLVKEIEELIFEQAHINSSAWRGLLLENGGIYMCSRTWIRSLIRRLNMRVSVATNEAQKLPKGWEITVVAAAAAADGTSLPYQVVLMGKTTKCLPSKEDCKPLLDLGWSITWSDNHWSNLETSTLLFDTVHLPYLLEATKKLNLPDDTQLCICSMSGVSISARLSCPPKGQGSMADCEVHSGQLYQCFNADFQREAVRLAFAGQLYTADEQQLIYQTMDQDHVTPLRTRNDDAAEELQQRLQQLSSLPGGSHAETLLPDWAQDAGRAAAMPAGTPVERDMILHAVGQEAAKKPMPLRVAKGKGKKQTGAKQRKGVSKQRAAAEPKRSQGRPTNAERQRRAAATTGYRYRLMRRQIRLLLGLLPLESPIGIESNSNSNGSDAEVDDELNSNGDGSEDEEEDAAMAATLTEAAAAPPPKSK